MTKASIQKIKPCSSHTARTEEALAKYLWQMYSTMIALLSNSDDDEDNICEIDFDVISRDDEKFFNITTRTACYRFICHAFGDKLEDK